MQTSDKVDVNDGDHVVLEELTLNPDSHMTTVNIIFMKL